MTTKIVYNTADGFEVLAHEDQVTAGLFHLPAGSTEIEPPSFDASKKICSFNGTEWIVADIPEPESEPVKEVTLTYADKRRNEYPSMGDQMDMIYKDMKNGTSTHADAVEVVKTKYPKG